MVEVSLIKYDGGPLSRQMEQQERKLQGRKEHGPGVTEKSSEPRVH